MPAAVSTVGASVSTAPPSRSPIVPACQDDSQCFKGELDRAQSQGSSSQAAGGDTQRTDPRLKANGDSGQSQASGKTGKPVHGVGKVPARQANKADPAIAKSGTAKSPLKADPESDAASSNGGNGQQQEAPPDRKPHKKSADRTAGSAEGAANQAAVVPAKIVETNATARDTESASHLSADQPSTSQVQHSTASLDGVKTGEIPIPAADASSQPTAALGPQTGRSSKARSADATENNGDPNIESAPNVAAAILSIAALPDPNGSNAQPVASDATTPVAKVAPKSIADGSLSGLAESAPASFRASNMAISSTNDAAQASPEAQFADANRAKIVAGITGKLLPEGGSMQLTLDPANLGPLQVRVEMKNGVMTASFETSNDQASKLLSHSLGDLKSALEAQGVTVEKLHVSQSPRQQSSSGDSRQGSSDPGQNTASQQEQQRKDMVRRMWRKLMKGQDPLDLVA